MLFKSAGKGWHHLVAASFVWSLIPLFAAMTHGGGAPFSFAGVWNLGAAGYMLVYVILRYRTSIGISGVKDMLPARGDLFKPLGNDRAIQTARFNWQILLTLPRSLNIAFFVWATAFIPTAIAAIISESWLILYLFLLHFLFRKDGEFQLNKTVMPLLLIPFGGACLVVSSTFTGIASFEDTLVNTMLGLALLCVSIFMTTQTSWFIRWSDVAHNFWAENRAPVSTSSTDKTCFFLIIRIVSLSIGGTIGIVLSIITADYLSLSNMILVFLGGGCSSLHRFLYTRPGNIQNIQKICVSVDKIPDSSYQHRLSLGFWLLRRHKNSVSACWFAIDSRRQHRNRMAANKIEC